MKAKKLVSLTMAAMMVLPAAAYGSEDPLADLPETLGPENPVAATRRRKILCSKNNSFCHT